MQFAANVHLDANAEYVPPAYLQTCYHVFTSNPYITIHTAQNTYVNYLGGCRPNFSGNETEQYARLAELGIIHDWTISTRIEITPGRGKKDGDS